MRIDSVTAHAFGPFVEEIGGGDLLLIRLARLDIGGHPLRPEIEHVAPHLEHVGKLLEQVIGRLAAIVFEVIQVGG